MSKERIIEGTIDSIDSIQTFDSGSSKREFVVEVADKFPQFIKMEVWKDKCESLDNFNIGDQVICKVNLKGNKVESGKWEGKVFNSIECWYMEINPDTVVTPAIEAEADEARANASSEDDDPLPF